MPALAATTAALLLVASPGGTSATDAVLLAARGGFLIGSAHRCGVALDRVLRAGDLVQGLITATASDEQDSQDASGRFTEFFGATAYPSEKDKRLPISCKAVLGEFARFESHKTLGNGAQAAVGAATPVFRLEDGE